MTPTPNPATIPIPEQEGPSDPRPAWERVAMNLRADPLPNTTPGSEAYLADARLADWMLQGLAPRPGQNIQEP